MDRRVYFAHQSVGDNVIAGLAEVLPDHPEIRLDLVHEHVGRNTKPTSKFEHFVRLLRDGRAEGCDLALMKLCYVDLGPSTDPTEVIRAYGEMVEEVRAAHPSLRLAHVTVPLTTRPTGLKAVAKRVLGRLDANVVRGRYNRMLREAYEPVFDLAAVESTHPDRTRETFEHEGETFHALVPEYTDDGGHLNATGRRAAADALLAFLAATP